MSVLFKSLLRSRCARAVEARRCQAPAVRSRGWISRRTQRNVTEDAPLIQSPNMPAALESSTFKVKLVLVYVFIFEWKKA